MTVEQASLPTKIFLRQEGTTSVPVSTVDAISILLDPNEDELFRILVDTAEAFTKGDINLDEWQANPEKRPQTVIIRVAGGWVRDKLVQHYGGEYDVDLAVEHMSGVQLARLIQIYVQKYHPQVQASRMGVIAANPAQSKHLETATFRLCGVDMDLCNLRSHEVYTEDSRIPIVRLGTPLEDALRRDFTVNALFYNLHSKQVEDWTGRGVCDLLSEPLLATPLEPVQTFHDDPLRILRAVRFAVRLQLPMEDSLQDAARLPEIRHALSVKVSRERFGKELEGMLSGKQARPMEALTTILDLGLASIVFALPQPGVDKIGEVTGTILDEAFEPGNEGHLNRAWAESKALLSLSSQFLERYGTFVKPEHVADARLFPLAVILLPFRKLLYNEAKKSDRYNSAVGYIIRESIKYKKDDVTAITLISDYVDTMVGLVEAVETVSRLDAGMLLRSVRAYWSTTLLLAALLKTRQDASLDWLTVAKNLYHKIVSDYDLNQCWKTKPLVNGKILQNFFGKGPVIGLYMQEQVCWMLSNPDGTVEDCLQHLKQYEPDPVNEEPKQKKAHISCT